MWEELSPLLPGQARSCGVTAADPRGFVEAVRGLGRTGAPWRDLPPHLGQWHRVYVRVTRWRDKGVWEQIIILLINNKRWITHRRQRQAQVDSISMRVHQHGTWAGRETANKA